MIIDRFQSKNKTALVTGASAGLGAAMAVALGEAGADVVCHGNGRSAERTCEKIKQIGRRAAALQADLSQDGAAQDLFSRAEKFAPIDVVINNAGMLRRAPAAEYSDQDWTTVLQVNLNSLWKLSQCAGKSWIEKKRGGKIINIASVLAFQGGINVAAYAASKGAVAQLTKALANEWAVLGINVNAIAPGYMRTDNTASLQQDEARNRQILERIPAGRWGEPDDLCGAVVFLASPASDYVQGHTLVVDGGWLGR
ncbi:MAG: SDR family oxidoreductase [Terriglobales bacterium]